MAGMPRSLNKSIHFVTALCLTTSVLWAEGHYTVSGDVREAYELIFRMEFGKAEAIIDRIEADDSDNFTSTASPGLHHVF